MINKLILCFAVLFLVGTASPPGVPRNLRGSAMPQTFMGVEMRKEKVYRYGESSNSVILLGDSLGLPDDFFLNNYLNFGGILLKE